jgi:hypothetical protein
MEPGDKLGSDPTVLENRLSSLDELTVLPIERLDQWTRHPVARRGMSLQTRNRAVSLPRFEALPCVRKEK